MNLEQVRINWEALAREDPLFAVSTAPGKQGGGWDAAEFFAGGRSLLASIEARAAELGLALEGRRALDFGCGVGRLARPLAERYAAVDAVDLSTAMLLEARRYAARDPLAARIRFAHHARPDLGGLPAGAYDLVLSHLTLQHVPPAIALRAIAAFPARLAAGGWLYFQLPERSHPSAERLLATRGPKARLRTLVPGVWLERWRLWRNGRGRMDMFGLASEAVRAALGERVELLAADAVDDTQGLLPSRRYFARAR